MIIITLLTIGLCCIWLSNAIARYKYNKTQELKLVPFHTVKPKKQCCGSKEGSCSSNNSTCD